jgi:autotransporter-associated beta strand protein
MNGGLLTVAGDGAVMGRCGSVSVLNLNGGTFAVKRIFRSGATPGDTTINWNGGVFQPNADGQTSKDIAHVYVSTNGCVVNVTNTMAHTMAFALTRDPALGAAADGGVTKRGTGTLSLTSAASTFTGPVNVEGGTLEVHGNMAEGSTKVTGALAIARDAVVDFGPNKVSTGTSIALFDVSEATDVSFPASVHVVGTGMSDSNLKAELSVQDGILYGTLKSFGFIFIFR